MQSWDSRQCRLLVIWFSLLHEAFLLLQEAIANGHDVHVVSNYHYILVIQKCVFCILHACYTLFSDIRNLQIHQLWSILKQFLKVFLKSYTIIGNFFKGNNHRFFFRLCIILETLVYRRILAICSQNCLPHGVGAKAPSSPKVSVPRGKPNKFLKIDKEVFWLLIPLHYTKMLKKPNGHYLSFVKAESMQLLFWGSV